MNKGMYLIRLIEFFHIASRRVVVKHKTIAAKTNSKAKNLTQSDEAFLSRVAGNGLFQSHAYNMAFAN